MVIRLLPLIRDMTNTAAPCPDASCCLMKTAILPVQSGAEGYAEYGYREPFAHFAMGHVTYFDWDNYHFVDGDSSNCESVYSVSYHGISSAAWIDGWGFHPFYCPTAVSCCATGNPVSVAVELSNTYEDSASLSKRVAESIRFE